MPLLRFIFNAVIKYYASVNYAIEGIIHGAKTQAHVRTHLVAGCFLLVISFVIGLSTEEFVILATLACIVIVSEMFNSAIEVTVDIASPEHSELARIAKDMAAGAVLVAALIAAVVGFFVLYPYCKDFAKNGIVIARHGAVDLVICSLIIVLVVVIMIKAYVGKGHPLRGGLPSGHASLAFCGWINVMYIFDNFLLTLIALLVAVVIAASRVFLRIHSSYEVFIGVALGSIITWGLYALFYQAGM